MLDERTNQAPALPVAERGGSSPRLSKSPTLLSIANRRSVMLTNSGES